jgi:hypothetical protein
MHHSQRMSFTIECLFERPDAVIEVRARRRVIVRLPLMKSEAESIQLRLEARQPLFEARIVSMHRGSAMMIHKNARSVSTFRLHDDDQDAVC